MENRPKDLPLGNVFFILFLGLSLFNILFNFLALPIVKWIYLGQLLTLFISLFLGKRENILWLFVLFSFFEGQGRVLWGYNQVFRLIFDIFLALMVLKELSRSKKVLDREILPNYLIVGIFLHFIWFIIEIFNPNGPSFFGALATSKYYIFPFFLFFLFKSFDFDFSKAIFQKKLQDCLFIFILIGILVLVQTINGEEHIFAISDYYQSLFPKYKNFVGPNFRPWGTSFLPGGMGTYFYCFIGFLLLYRPKSVYKGNVPKMAMGSLFKWGGLGIILYASFLGQVRSATLKLVGICALFFFLKFIGSRLKARRAIMVMLFGVFLGLIAPFVSGPTLDEDDYSSKSIERWEGVLSTDMLNHRAGMDLFIDTLEKKVELPFGYGLGMTQSFLPDFAARRRQYVNADPTLFWHLDNLMMFLFLELGFGALIYLFIIVSVLISLFSRLFTLMRWREMTAFSILCASCASTLVIVIFNWGAVGLPFNPESFYFWVWSALGFSTFYFTKKRRVEN